MEKYFCDCEYSKKLLELGFNEECFAIYDGTGNFRIIEQNGLHTEDENRDKCDSVNNTFIAIESEDKDCVSAPLWIQVREWLWNRYKAQFSAVRNGTYTFVCFDFDGNQSSFSKVERFSKIEVEVDVIKIIIDHILGKVR